MKIKLITDDPTVNLVLDTLEKKKQAIVFANTKRSAEKCAEDIADQIKNTNEHFMEMSEKALHAISSPTKQCKRLANCLKKGIAFHHAGLTYKQRELVEDNFREGKLKVICSTPTLAYGLDLPAYRVVLKDLRRFTHRGMQFIPVLEYLQMAGRAGRPKFDKAGEAVAVCNSEDNKNKITEKYIHGLPEDIESKLAVEPVLRTYLLSLIATNFVNTKEEILKFFEGTFWSYQFEDMNRLELIIEKILNMLIDWEFISTQSNSKGDEGANAFKSADDLADSPYEATLVGKRVAELYIDPLTAHDFVNGLKKSKDTSLKSFSFLHLVASTLEMRPLLKVKTKEYEDIQSDLLKYEDCLLNLEPSIYESEFDEYLNGIKTALMLQDWIDEKDEEYILEKYSVRPGELRVKIGNADWLLYGADEIARLLKLQKVISEIKKTRFRLKHGAKEELISLLKIKNIGRVRARKMFNNGIKTIGDVKKADVMKLIQLIGRNTTIKVKEEVGEKIDLAIQPGKRKGQLSLSKFTK